MGTSETKLWDGQGKYLHALSDGQELSDARWQQCRVVLTDRRVVLAADETVSVPLEKIGRVGERYDVNQAAAGESEYTTVYVGEDVLLVATADHGAFEAALYAAIIDGAVIYVNHRAVVGGVVQEADWTRGRLELADDALRVSLEDGDAFAIDRADISASGSSKREVAGERRTVLEVEHSEDGKSVQTYLCGRERHLSVLRQLFEDDAGQNRVDLDLDPLERRVVMALYSGISPFAVSEFVGTDVETVEGIYDRLIELGVVEVVRERADVSLTPEGRRVAGESMSEQ